MLDVLNLKGAVVTLDALHLEKISEKNAHVVCNQPLSQFDAGKEKVCCGHGREEARYVFQLKAKLPPLAAKWPRSTKAGGYVLSVHCSQT